MQKPPPFIPLNEHLFDEVNNASSILAPLFSQTHYPWEILDLLPSFLAHLLEHHRPLNRLPTDLPITIEGPVYIDPSAKIEPFVSIYGPAWIGPQVTIRQGAYLRGSVLACNESVIGHCTEIKGSILLPHAKAAHFAYIGDSILGQSVNLGAGVRLANLRLDRKEVAIKSTKALYETKRKKCGAFLGDGCQVGCNSVCNPGTILGPKSLVRPLVSLQHLYAPKSRV